MKPSTTMLERLSTSRFLVNRAQPSVGAGERRSKAKGAGLEFVDHRPYREGDDVRHLDPRLLARLGENFIRQFSVDKRLPVFILLDASASMGYGEPDKFAFARGLAQALGFIGLNGGDQVQAGVFTDGRLVWSPHVHGTSRAPILFDWLDGQEASGGGAFTDALRKALPHIKSASLLILISDFWGEEPARALRALDAAHHEIIAFHVSAPQEIDPKGIGDGPLDIIDAETGEEVELALDADVLSRYRKAFDEWQETLREQFVRRQGRYFALSSATDLEHLFMRQLRALGVIS
ncbi:DUF58 domain-containing protein [Arsenicitalea aurantiaca]|uniref:DUF58 domain-containing protein n=1 Tax=Arsenicitalea aurantiaca TaxID=1783274 RepID=A0A433XAG9_9HYPH|nr:DUF58 domain-containing protein [Arsenicitalea aurantiaca]RUT31053.1 DUF58 domain-containing protein [Arsenicitalea aurantiaca]